MPSFWSRYTQCIVTHCLMPSSSHNTLQCIATQKPSSQTLSCHDTIICIVTFTPCQIARSGCNTIWCLAIQFPNQLHTQDYSAVTIQQLYRDTLSPSQLAQPTHPKAMSRYNFPLYHDTVLGSSPNQFLHLFFSFFFRHFFFPFHATEKNPKKYISIFFSFSSTPNKLIKFIFFIFSSVLPTVKPKFFFSFLNFFFHFHHLPCYSIHSKNFELNFNLFFFSFNCGPFCPTIFEHLRF